jgi:predicted metalloprotease with PDZ domain
MNRFFTLIILALMIQGSIAGAAPSIHFEVSFTEPQAHYAEVNMQVSGVAKDYVDIKMPVWAPGSYLIREFAKNVEGLSAADKSGKKIGVQHISKNTWRILSEKADFTVSYRVYCFEISVRTPFIDTSHAFLSPTGIFMYPDGMISEPSTVTVKPFEGWTKISTGLEPVSGKANTFSAADFDILFDSPIEVGNQEVFGFDVAGVRYEVAMYGGGNYDVNRLMTDLPGVITHESAVFGENPNKRYVFIVHNYNTGSGGLEHLNSCVLGVSRFSYGTEAGYLGFLRLAAHEHFHLWNVKRLRPKALGPFDYENENYTTNLWIAEGFTSFYDKLMMNRAGFQSAEKYLDAVLGDIRTVENQPGNRIQSVSESSFDAWIKYYRPGENSRNATISYYNKGAIIGLLMNLEILHATKGRKSLDDVMRAMYEEYYKNQKRGYTDAEFRAMAEEIAGISLAKIYDKYVNGTEPVNYNEYFQYAGLRVVTDTPGRSKPALGATISLYGGRLMVAHVDRGSSAWDSGLNVNDEIVAINGSRLNATQLSDPAISNEADKAIAGMQVGDSFDMLIARDGLIRKIRITLKGNPLTTFRIVAEETPDPLQLEVRRKWLKLPI